MDGEQQKLTPENSNELLDRPEQEKMTVSTSCQSAFKFDPPCASKNDPPQVFVFKGTSGDFGGGGGEERWSVAPPLFTPPSCIPIRARPFAKDVLASDGFRFLFQ